MRFDYDSFCCIVGGALVGAGRYVDTLLPEGVTQETIAQAESQSILEIKIRLTELYYVTPADCLTVLGSIIGFIGVCNMIYKKIRGEK